MNETIVFDVNNMSGAASNLMSCKGTDNTTIHLAKNEASKETSVIQVDTSSHSKPRMAEGETWYADIVNYLYKRYFRDNFNSRIRKKLV